MSVDGYRVPAVMKSVAVAVNGRVNDSNGGRGSRRAVHWAMENLMPKADRFILLHVIPTITSIPTPSGSRIPVEELDENVVAIYVQDLKHKFEQVFIPFKKLCKTRSIETVVLEDDNIADALLRYASDSGINSLVLGSCSSNYITRKLKGPDVPTTVLSCAPAICDLYVVSRDKIITKLAEPFLASDSIIEMAFGAPSLSDLSDSSSLAFTHMGSSPNCSLNEENSHHNFKSNMGTATIRYLESTGSRKTHQSGVQEEVEQLRLELQNTVAMYKTACEELVHTQNKVQLLSSGFLEESRRVHAALKREETFRKVAAEQKVKQLQATQEVEEAKILLAKETFERKIAELNALKESLEKQRIADELFYSDNRYRRYSRNEIEVATNFFSEANVIGEGGYGKVYKCSLDHTPVAVKVLSPDAGDKKGEFMAEVEVLSKLRHPNMVLLLGACPESGCLVYEYMENGSLDEYIYQRNGKSPLPWFIRFRIIFEVACGLAFLHNSKPDPIVHRDLKPGNILLDKYHVSKIGDVGLAKLISDVVPDNITEYRDSVLAGTIFYMDPEYQRTGTVRPKSDLYAFGVITLQLLTGRLPKGLLVAVENAIKYNSLTGILDASVTNWPLAETEELARLALKCSQLRCRDRPDLDTEVLPILKKCNDVAKACNKEEGSSTYPPSHYFCPILQEIMDDPHIAADGFTYEYRAIKAWVERHNVSPVTKVKLQHSLLTPNYTLHSAIQEWRSRTTFPTTVVDKRS